MTLSGPARRVLVASLIGSTIEWFDFFLYGAAAALVFGTLFFPTTDPHVSLLLSYASFAVPFFIRPLGGAVFAHIGDRLGRKKTLVITLSLMGVGTMLIGLLPTYRSIGIAAPILLVALRLVQGFGLGGEWGGAVLLAYESAPPGRQGFFGSIPQSGGTIGLLLSTVFMAAASLLPDSAFMEWGWRVPFVLSAGLVLLGLWIRAGIDETPDFKALRAAGQIARFPLLDVLRSHRRALVTAILAKFGETVSFYIFAVFFVSYATKEMGLPRVTALATVAVGALVATGMIPACGLLSDRIGRRPTFLIGSAALIVVAGPYFWLLAQRSTVCIVLATVVAMGVAWPFVTAALGTLFAELFPPEVRYSGISLGYHIGAALVGGTAPLVATLMLAADHGRWRWVAVYVAANALVSLLAVATTSVARRGSATARVTGAPPGRAVTAVSSRGRSHDSGGRRRSRRNAWRWRGAD